jgi:formamidopyrimidine-DNA glycosylase
VPELPDITVYCEAIDRRTHGQPLESVRVVSPFVLRSVEPAPAAAVGRSVVGVERLGKRIVIELEGAIFFVFHLMIAGRLHWHETGRKVPTRSIVALGFANGTLALTEAGKKKRASLHVVAGRDELARLDPGGIEIAAADLETFRATLTRENHTLKRALTDPRIFSGIGNAYSDEILHHAKLSPVKQTNACDDDEIARLYGGVRVVLAAWTERIRAQAGTAFPEHVTAFREGMAVHGRYRKPCPDCGEPIQRIVYSQNECNYCARCQTGGRLLADRALSRLLHKDWPRTADELEERLTRR